MSAEITIVTREMHTGGEPLRIVENGYPEIKGTTILEQRNYAKKNLDHLRQLIMFEPRGHYDMYGALQVRPTIQDADLAVLFVHNEGYSTMCGHAVIALGRYAIDSGIVKAPTAPETEVCIQCPCGLVKAYTEYDAVTKKTGATRFHSVPAFVFKLDFPVTVPGYGSFTVDVSYGGAFYALVEDSKLGIDVNTTNIQDVISAASAVSEVVKKTLKLSHPESDDLAFLYGTIVTDGNDKFTQDATANICVFADKEVDRCPTGSGVTARVAAHYKRGLISARQKREFLQPKAGSRFTGQVVENVTYGEYSDAVVVEVAGNAYYTGSATFTVEDDDPMAGGFLLK